MDEENVIAPDEENVSGAGNQQLGEVMAEENVIAPDEENVSGAGNQLDHVDPTGHPLHPSGRRLSEYEWPENQTTEEE